VQKALSYSGYRLVRLTRESDLSLEIVDRKRKVDGSDTAKTTPQGDLENWFRQAGPVRIHKWQHYFEIYERHLAPFRGKSVKLLEIGVCKGGTLPMWKSYFGSNSTIVGADIDPTCKQFENASANIYVRIGDQESDKFLASVQQEFGPFDIVIDDGGHTTSQQIQSFLQLYFLAMKPDGIYLVEDLHTNYWPEYVTYATGLTFVDFARNLVDRLHDAYKGHSGQFHRFDAKSPERFQTLEVSNFCAQTGSIHFYDSIVVFERRPKTIPYHEER